MIKRPNDNQKKFFGLAAFYLVSSIILYAIKK